MVVTKAINKLKDGPNEDKQMVAIGGAGLVVLLLLVAWGYIFIKRIQSERLSTPSDIYQAEQSQTRPTAPSNNGSQILQPLPSRTNEFGQPTDVSQ